MSAYVCIYTYMCMSVCVYRASPSNGLGIHSESQRWVCLLFNEILHGRRVSRCHSRTCSRRGGGGIKIIFFGDKEIPECSTARACSIVRVRVCVCAYACVCLCVCVDVCVCVCMCVCVCVCVCLYV